MSVLIVILLVSVAMMVSYAVLRDQSTSAHIQSNADNLVSARQAAMTGLTYGVRAMHSQDWTGVDTTASRSLGAYERFTVSFTAGDASLGPGSPQYGDIPYRVTIHSIGEADDPRGTGRTTSYTVHAVMRLIPRELSNRPTDWSKMEGYTVYQTKREATDLNFPFQIAGKVRFQGRVNLGLNYPDYYTAWQSYLYHLGRMPNQGHPDYRSFTGRTCLPLTEQGGTTSFLFAVQLLGCNATWMGIDEVASDWVKPANLSTYQIYPGGPVYEITQLDEVLSGTVLEPDPLTNPLGLFYRHGNSKLEGEVLVRGTLFCRDTVEIRGANVRFEPVEMPPLFGETRPIRMPALTGQNVKVKPGSETEITGLVAVFDQFLIEKSPATLPLKLVGRLVTRKLYIREREPWDTVNWQQNYMAYAYASSTYYPIWLASQGYDSAPRIKMMPDPELVQYHWTDCSGPIYVPHPNDGGGLRWQMLEWNEGER
ncbi:MAG: hypothetical protein GX621_10295 [Pirellulaceae bacterium]|nr:hypothetical protein [Pirellulaceae bacterium]